jgi:hypothetical protein
MVLGMSLPFSDYMTAFYMSSGGVLSCGASGFERPLNVVRFGLYVAGARWRQFGRRQRSLRCYGWVVFFLMLL